MPITAAQLTEFRKREWSEAQKREAKTGSLICTYETIAGCQVQIDKKMAKAAGAPVEF